MDQYLNTQKGNSLQTSARKSASDIFKLSSQNYLFKYSNSLHKINYLNIHGDINIYII